MAHLHEVRDTDTHFTVNPISRTITNTTSTKKSLIQFDHNSEVFTFEMPRYIEGHDMTLCNRAEVHYINIDSSTREQSVGVYEIEDLEESEDDPNTMLWSWTVSSNATQNVGPLSFAFRFACVTESDGVEDEEVVVEYAWNTAPCSAIVIAHGIYNGEAIIEEYTDILEQWERKIGVGVEDIEQTQLSGEPNGVNVITMTLTDGRTTSFQVRNGLTPIRGVDYWTQSDIQAIIDDIHGIIPEAEGVSF